jgi:hypothetical protein
VPYIMIIPARADSFHQKGSDFFDGRKFVDSGCHLYRHVTEARCSRDRFEKKEGMKTNERKESKVKREREKKEREQRPVHVED